MAEDGARQTVRFMRYERDGTVAETVDVPMDHFGDAVPYFDGATWVSEELYRAASRPTVFYDEGAAPKRLAWHARVRLWLYWHLPRVHFGPCNHDECGW